MSTYTAPPTPFAPRVARVVSDSFAGARAWALGAGLRSALEAADEKRVITIISNAIEHGGVELQAHLEGLLAGTLVAGARAARQQLGLRAAIGNGNNQYRHDHESQYADQPTTRPDGAPVKPEPLPGSRAERRGLKVGTEVFYSATSGGLHGVERGTPLNGAGVVRGFVSNRRASLPTGAVGGGKAGQDVLIHDAKRGSWMFIDDSNVRPRRLRNAAADDGIDAKFDVTNPAATAWAKKRAADLVTQINATTRDRINALVEEAFADQFDVDTLASEIDEVLGGDPVRAELIARTETMAAANAGQLAAWDQAVTDGKLSGREQKVWIVTPDDRLCPICAPLEDVTLPLDDAFDVDGDELDGPPAHPNCRCTLGLTL